MFHRVGHQLTGYELSGVLRHVVDLPLRAHVANQLAGRCGGSGVTGQLDADSHHRWTGIDRGLGL
jgi:hypothetical protein